MVTQLRNCRRQNNAVLQVTRLRRLFARESLNSKSSTSIPSITILLGTTTLCRTVQMPPYMVRESILLETPPNLQKDSRDQLTERLWNAPSTPQLISWSVKLELWPAWLPSWSSHLFTRSRYLLLTQLLEALWRLLSTFEETLESSGWKSSELVGNYSLSRSMKSSSYFLVHIPAHCWILRCRLLHHHQVHRSPQERHLPMVSLALSRLHGFHFDCQPLRQYLRRV